jgi:hypothetical protein
MDVAGAFGLAHRSGQAVEGAADVAGDVAADDGGPR